jgi:hypothetical protein
MYDLTSNKQIKLFNDTVTDSRKGGHCYLHGNEGNNSFNCRNLATASYAGNHSTARKRSDNRE